ncbi:MAG: tetratricopeptide repeat protein [PVC group bacterium]|nr:tetratricopeptide repeat protein [PVC group bacterium]
MKNRFKINLIVLVLLCLFCSNVFAYTFSSNAREIIAAILQGHYRDALDKCYALEYEAAGVVKGEALYLQGACLMQRSDYKEARDAFKQALPFIEGDLVIEAYMGIADTYFEQYTFKDAISIYEQLLVQYQDSDYEAMLYYKVGKAHQKLSEWVKAEQYFEKLKKKFPDSFENELVARNSTGGNFFTIQVGSFTNKPNAQKLHNDLKNKGYEVYITDLQINGHKVYRVRVGKFVSRIAAEYAENRLRNQESLPTHMFP